MGKLENFVFGKYNFTNSSAYSLQVCYMQELVGKDTAWRVENPSQRALPLLAMQISVMLLLSRMLVFILKPIRQPRFVAEVIAGIILGPSIFGKMTISHLVFPFETNMLLETFGQLGLAYYMFLVGLEVEVSDIKHMERKSLGVAIPGILIPMVIGAALYFLPMRSIDRVSNPWGAAFWAITLSTTSFPDLARILSDVKLLQTDLGKAALVTAVISDIFTWVLLIVAITVFDNQKLWFSVPLTIGFLVISWFVLRPCIARIIKYKKREGGEIGETYIYYALAGVTIFGLITDACGSHSAMGAFMLGLIIPKGDLAIKIMERIDEFVNRILLPCFMLINGLRTNFDDVIYKTHYEIVVFIVIVATSAKILSTVFVSSSLGMTKQDGLALGSLLNTKGVLALIVLNEGRTLLAMDNITMSLMVLIILIMSILVGPLSFLTNKTLKRKIKYKQRSIQRSNANTEFRVLACIHSARNVSGIVKLLEVSCATKKSPISVCAVHLLELTGRAASAMLIVHNPKKPSIGTNTTREKAESDHIINAFQKYKDDNDASTVQSLTAVSPFTTMHEDIFNLAEDKHASLILIPFDEKNHPIKEVNKNLLVNPPCSVGLFVDRGLGSSVPQPSSNDNKFGLRFAMLFVSGPDDHEALTYAWRMSGTADVALTVVRFVSGKDTEDKHKDGVASKDRYGDEEDPLTSHLTETETWKDLDDEFINDFRFKTMCESSIIYQEKQVNNGAEIVEAIRTMDSDFDLYIVGRSLGVKSPLMAGLSEWSVSRELGPIGEVLISSEFTESSSVLEIQRYVTSTKKFNGKTGGKKWASPILNPDYDGLKSIK